MNANDVKVHNYRMSVQEVPIVSGTVVYNNRTYNMWLLGNEAYCYAPELGPQMENDFGYSYQEGMNYYTKSLMEMTMSGGLGSILDILK